MRKINQDSYQQQIVKLLNEYLSNVAVLIVKLYNFHWNIVGADFFSTHEKLETYYKEVTNIYDEVGERIKQLYGFPITSLKTYSQVAQIIELESRNYSQREIVINLIKDFCYMVEITNYIIKFAGKNADEATVAIFNNYLVFFEKQLWMLRAHLK